MREGGKEGVTATQMELEPEYPSVHNRLRILKVYKFRVRPKIAPSYAERMWEIRALIALGYARCSKR